MTSQIPLVDLTFQHVEIADEIALGWADVIRTMSFVMGKQVREFENAFATPTQWATD